MLPKILSDVDEGGDILEEATPIGIEMSHHKIHTYWCAVTGFTFN